MPIHFFFFPLFFVFFFLPPRWRDPRKVKSNPPQIRAKQTPTAIDSVAVDSLLMWSKAVFLAQSSDACTDIFQIVTTLTIELQYFVSTLITLGTRFSVEAKVVSIVTRFWRGWLSLGWWVRWFRRCFVSSSGINVIHDQQTPYAHRPDRECHKNTKIKEELDAESKERPNDPQTVIKEDASN